MSVVASKSAPVRKPWKWVPGTQGALKMTVPALLWALHEMGGSIEDRPTGRCSTKLVTEAKKKGFTVDIHHDPVRHGGKSSALSSLLKELENGRYAGCIKRETNGKRTLQIDLLLTEAELPPRPFPVVVKKMEPKRPEIGDTRPAPVRQQSVFVQPVTEAPTAEGPSAGDTTAEPEPTIQPELTVAAPGPVDVADPTLLPPLIPIMGDPVSLLLQIQQLSVDAVMAVAAGIGNQEDGEGDKTERDERLAATLAENDRLRRKVNDHAETINAKVKEINALRKALTTAQGNLRAIQENANNAATTERNLARLKGNQRFISERPEAAIAGRRGA